MAVVTGGSRGIGRAVSLLLAERGYAVCLSYVSDAAAAQSVVSAIEAAGGRAVAVRGDVGVEADVLALFEAADELGAVTALINNAGVVDVGSRVDGMSAERLHRMMTTNVVGSFLCAREAVRRMSTKHGGRGGGIVNLSSVAGEGIRVNAVSPGIIDTDIHASGGQPDRVARMGPDQPMGRAGTAEEVAAPIAWLLSDEAAYTTGANLDIAGGR